MRTNIDAIVANCNVFGFGQDGIVATWNVETCDHAAQHLTQWHASKHARSLSRVLKRRDLRVVAGAVLEAMAMCLAYAGPGRGPARRLSPELVMA